MDCFFHNLLRLSTRFTTERPIGIITIASSQVNTQIQRESSHLDSALIDRSTMENTRIVLKTSFNSNQNGLR
ncbi:Uncharacterised protein [Klebsiella pneumoniae]|nr:Uncharacterised protein [Klebsiella pneumoniae]